MNLIVVLAGRKSCGLFYEIQYPHRPVGAFVSLKIWPPPRRPAIFSKASARVPWRSGVNVCKNSRSAAPPKTMQAHEDGASRTGEAKKHANDRKGDQVFKMSIVSHFRKVKSTARLWRL
jgi:hypothetical protein